MNTGFAVDYTSLLAETAGKPYAEIAAFLALELPPIWRESYLTMTDRYSDILVMRLGNFEYIYDAYDSLLPEREIPQRTDQEPRLVAAQGLSVPQLHARDDYRLKGWVAPTEKTFGKGWDKGHFIAHSYGGSVDGCEMNVFVQARRWNRGWSEEGKRYRKMESYCVEQPGTFCFSRPIYTTGLSRPCYLEFGVLKEDGSLWWERFSNLGPKT